MSSALGDERFNTYGLIHFGRTEVIVEIRRLDAKGSIPPNQALVSRNSFPYTHHV